MCVFKQLKVITSPEMWPVLSFCTRFTTRGFMITNFRETFARQKQTWRALHSNDCEMSYFSPTRSRQCTGSIPGSILVKSKWRPSVTEIGVASRQCRSCDKQQQFRNPNAKRQWSVQSGQSQVSQVSSGSACLLSQARVWGIDSGWKWWNFVTKNEQRRIEGTTLNTPP